MRENKPFWHHEKKRANASREYFLAGGGLTWIFVAGSITITNLGTEQLVGMNGNQMALLALWEISGMVGLLFKGVDAKAAIAEVIFGIALAFFTFVYAPFGLHYIHLMFVTLWTTVGFALGVNHFVLGNRATFAPFWREGPLAAAADKPV